MKKNIQKLFSNKTYRNTIIILALIFVSLSSYLFISIYANVKKMAEDTKSVTYYPSYPSFNVPEGKDFNQIKRGEYLVKAGDCIACHTNTPAKGKPFAGGLPMRTAFGTIYSPNITSDKKTGIGNWTEAQFIRAMREGISPHNSYYYPAFPYYYFNRVSIDDLKAIKAYLDVIPSVYQKNHENEMVWPFNWRFLQIGWRLLFFKPKPDNFLARDKHSEQWLRGNYLVEGLGHCAMCHSPSYHIVSETLSLGAPIERYNLTGAKIQGYLAPNITALNLANIPSQQIIDVFTRDQLIGGGKVEGPMLEANHNSLKYLTRTDLLAIATYLKTVKSELPPKPKTGSGGPGKDTYESYCAGCHATGAGSAPKYGNVSDWEPLIKEGIDKVYNNALHGIGGMPAKGTCLSCSDKEIKDAVDYMVSAIKGGSNKNHSYVSKVRVLTIEDGKRIYQQNCTACHELGFNHAPKLGDQQAWQASINSGFLDTYNDVITGRKGHPPRGACSSCTDGDLKAAVKYMMGQAAPNKDYSLW